MTPDPLALLAAAVQACEEVGAGYALIGALARNVWAPPRATADVDLAVAVEAASYASLLAALERRGVALKRTVVADPGASVPDVVLLESATGVVRRLDLLVAKTAFEREAIATATVQDVGVRCRVVQPEHLVVYKLIAGRPRDLADAEEVVRTRALAGTPVDFGVVDRWAGEWGLADLMQRLRADVEKGPG